MTVNNVLFACLHGSAKSMIAAEHLRRLAAEREVDVHISNGGTEPDPEIPPRVVDGLRADGIDVAGRVPRALQRADVAAASHIVTFGCEIAHVVPVGTRVHRWDDVPMVSDGYDAARAAIVARVARLLDEIAR